MGTTIDMRGWHFTTEDEILGFDDGRKIIVGEKHTVEPPIKLCKRGLHASERIIDALDYAPGPILLRGTFRGGNKGTDND